MTEQEKFDKKVADALKAHADKLTRKQRLFDAVKANKSKLYKWSKVETGMRSYARTDEDILKLLHHELGENVLRAFLEKYIPLQKDDTIKLIENQITELEK
jgi:hypothetical protein